MISTKLVVVEIYQCAFHTLSQQEVLVSDIVYIVIIINTNIRYVVQ